MSLLRRRLRTVALLALAGATGGCGTTLAIHEDRYAARLQADRVTLLQGVGPVLRAITPQTAPAVAAGALGRWELVLGQVEQRLRALRAPPTASRLHRGLIKTIDRYGAEVRTAILALRQPRPKLLAAEKRFLAATERMTATVQRTFAGISAVLARDRAHQER